jgi:uncharacterized membrane protein
MWRLTLLSTAIFILVFSVFTIGRYERYNATGFDLAFYDQILWRTARGDIMGMSIEGDNFSNWAFHVEPILLFMAPFKLIFTDTRWLLIVQTIALAIGTIPIYRIAYRQWGKPGIAFAFALLYLLYPTVGWANKFDFHPLTLTTPLLLFAWDAAELRRWRLTSLLLLLAMFCKEEVGVVVALFGLFWALSPERWRTGYLWFVVGIAWMLIGLFVIIPGAQGKILLPNQADLRYAWLFRGSWAERWAYITGPDTIVKIRFLVQLLLPLLFLPVLKPRIFLIGAPIIGLAVLSSRLSQSSVYHHYMCDVIPFLFVGAIKASHELGDRLRRIGLRVRPRTVQRATFIGMFTATLLMFIVFNPFFFIPRDPYAPIYGWESGASLDGLRAAEAMIPAESCLTTSNNIAAHYGQRTYLYVIGIGNYTNCDQVMVDMADKRFVSFGVPQDYVCQIRDKFQPVFFQDNVVILRQNAPANPVLADKLARACEAHSAGTATPPAS